MADGLPPIQMDFNANGDPVVIVEEKQISNPAEILRTVPVLAEPNMVFAYAQLVNHLAHGDGFEIILDPEAFKAEFMAKWNAEDPDAEPVQGAPILHDFGMPDFDQIAEPSFAGGALTYYAVNSFMGMPYKAVMKGSGKPEYTPVRIVN